MPTAYQTLMLAASMVRTRAGCRTRPRQPGSRGATTGSFPFSLRRPAPSAKRRTPTRAFSRAVLASQAHRATTTTLRCALLAVSRQPLATNAVIAVHEPVQAAGQPRGRSVADFLAPDFGREPSSPP